MSARGSKPFDRAAAQDTIVAYLATVPGWQTVADIARAIGRGVLSTATLARNLYVANRIAWAGDGPNGGKPQRYAALGTPRPAPVVVAPKAADPMPSHWIAALRQLEADPRNPVGPHYVKAGTLAALRRRGLVGKVVAKGHAARLRRTTSPITPAGYAVLDAADGPSWGVEMRNHLHTPSDPDDEPAFFRREFRARTREEAHAAAVAWGEASGDCSPAGGVDDVEGPLWAAPVGEAAR